MELKGKIESKEARVSIIGLGYIGLPTAALFAGNGLQVVGVDVNRNIVDRVNKGEIHIVEPDLKERVADAQPTSTAGRNLLSNPGFEGNVFSGGCRRRGRRNMEIRTPGGVSRLEGGTAAVSA